MADELKSIYDYPDISFIDGYTLEKLNTKMLNWYLDKREELTGERITLSLADDRRLRLQTDAYMIYQAKALGASAVLLICSVLDDSELKNFHRLSEELHMSALVEARDAVEISRAKEAGASIIGVNNRNLKDFSVDISHSAQLRELAGEDVVFVSESGIRGAEDIKPLYENGTDAVLIGEMLMRSPDRQETLKNLIRAGKKR